MTSERASAYGRVMKALSDLGPTKLHESEQETVREAADSILFAATPAAAEEAIAPVLDLADTLIQSDRLLRETADQLVRDLIACGPRAPLATAA